MRSRHALVVVGRALRSAVYNRMVEGGVRSRLAGRMYGAGSRNGDADACVARVVVLVCVVVGGWCVVGWGERCPFGQIFGTRA